MKCLIAEESQVTLSRNDAVHIAPLSLLYNDQCTSQLAPLSVLYNLSARDLRLHDRLLLPSPPNHPVQALDFDHKKKWHFSREHSKKWFNEWQVRQNPKIYVSFLVGSFSGLLDFRQDKVWKYKNANGRKEGLWRWEDKPETGLGRHGRGYNMLHRGRHQVLHQLLKVFQAKKYGSSHIKNDKPVVLWKKLDQSKEVQFWWGFKYISTVQVCRMPSANYSPKHKCMGTKIGRHRVQNIAITHRLQRDYLGQSRTHSWPAQTCMGKLRHVQVLVSDENSWHLWFPGIFHLNGGNITWSMAWWSCSTTPAWILTVVESNSWQGWSTPWKAASGSM